MAGVKVDPPPFKDKITDGEGNITQEFHDFLYRLWNRTGGDSDILDFISKMQSNRVYQQQMDAALSGDNAFVALSFMTSRTPIDHKRLDNLEEDVSRLTSLNFPTGGIIMWSGATIPEGWKLCDGTNDTPDLRDRFIVGSGGVYATGDTGGSDSHTTTTNQVSTGTDFDAVEDSSIPILPPYYALAYIMKDEDVE